MMSDFLSAARWPWVVAPRTLLFVRSNQKFVVRSRSNVNAMILRDQMNYLFSTDVFFAQFHDQQKLLQDSLEHMLIDKRRLMMIRVLLAEHSHLSPVQWRFFSAQGFMVQPMTDGHVTGKKALRGNEFTIEVSSRGYLICNGKRLLNRAIRLRPVCGHGEFNGTVYDGDFFIVPYKNSFLCINQVELENYIAAVLRTESWPGWPLEVNKVFAIACRSYVVYQALQANRVQRPYHVKNTNAHQTYRGKHDVPLLKAAVEQTHGTVLGFDGKPILAMFDCCCGGVIPAHIADFNFQKVPYLARSYACHHCKQSSLYTWQVSYEQLIFEKLIQQYVDKISRLFDIHIVKKDKAGLVLEVKLRGSKDHTILSGKKLYSLLKEIKSFYFDVQKKSGKIIFTGRGFGHHLGLCQWGARQMVRDGWDYKYILKFYYPGTNFMQLT